MNQSGGVQSRCQQSKDKKYRDRPSPPYPANDCKNMKKKGNDGQEWISRSNKNGVYSWLIVKDESEVYDLTKFNNFKITRDNSTLIEKPAYKQVCELDSNGLLHIIMSSRYIRSIYEIIRELNPLI